MLHLRFPYLTHDDDAALLVYRELATFPNMSREVKTDLNSNLLTLCVKTRFLGFFFFL